MNGRFGQWLSKHFETATHTRSASEYAMIFVSQTPYSEICTCLIVIPTAQTEAALEMVRYWYARTGFEKKDYWHANHPRNARDQGVFNKQVLPKFRERIHEIDERQIYSCKRPSEYFHGDPFFIHFHSFLRRPYIAPKCGTYDIYHAALQSGGIYDNFTEHVREIQRCCVHTLNFTELQEQIYT